VCAQADRGNTEGVVPLADPEVLERIISSI
jgi:hypothetical protein